MFGLILTTTKYTFQDGYTALHIAAIGGHTAMVKTLLSYQANLYKKDVVCFLSGILMLIFKLHE